jgi:OHCU decarboxylase
LTAPTSEDRFAATGADLHHDLVSVDELDALHPHRAQTFLEQMVGSRRWVALMVQRRPYGSREALMTAAAAAFDELSDADWREAFAAHSAIGAPRPDDSRGAAEQTGAAAATPQQRAAQTAGNARYEQRFGHVFLIRAAGRGPEEILQALTQRLGNDPATELRIAAEQQREITLRRLSELVGP